MSWFSKEVREARWKKIYTTVWVWWKTVGSREVKKIWKETIGAYVAIYRKEILNIVKNIALGNSLQDGESKKDAFSRLVKDLLDRNKDGMVTWDDMPESIQDYLRSYMLWLFRSFGDSDQARADVVDKL